MVQPCPTHTHSPSGTGNIILIVILTLGHSSSRGSGTPARAALAQLKTLNTYLDFKIHVLQKFLVHCLCKFVDGSQEDPKKTQSSDTDKWM